MSSFFLKQGDTNPAIQYTFLDENNAAIDLTGSTVLFYLQDDSGNIVIDGGSCTLVDAANGIVAYQWATGDSATSGTYFAEFVATLTDATIRTSPDPGWIVVIVTSSLRS